MAPPRRQPDSLAESGGGMKKEIIQLIESHQKEAAEWLECHSAGLTRLHDAVTTAENERLHFAEKLKSGDLSDFNGRISEMGALAIFEDARSIINSHRASKPRPRKAPTAKSLTVAAMRKARKEGQSLSQFLASAGAGSVEGLEIKPANQRGVERYAIDSDELKEPKTVAMKSLWEWFAEAGKQTTPD